MVWDKKIRPADRSNSDPIKTLVNNAIQLQHYVRAAQQFFEFQQLKKGEDITAVASAWRDDFNVGSLRGIEGHGIQVNTVDKFFQSEKTRKFICGYITGKIQFKTTLVVALKNTAIWGSEDLL